MMSLCHGGRPVDENGVLIETDAEKDADPEGDEDPEEQNPTML
jgi:hypothetical protein